MRGDTFDLDELQQHVEAEEFRCLGDRRFASGDHEDAAAYYQMSLDIYPTADAHVALAWTIAGRGLLAEAIAHCEAAIALEPAFGNAYNDWGVYLLRQSDTEADKDRAADLLVQAVRLFERAIAAERYDCRNYPHYHLGRIREQQGRFSEARDYYTQSLRLDPYFAPAQKAHRRTLSWLN